MKQNKQPTRRNERLAVCGPVYYNYKKLYGKCMSYSMARQAITYLVKNKVPIVMDSKPEMVFTDYVSLYDAHDVKNLYRHVVLYSKAHNAVIKLMVSAAWSKCYTCHVRERHAATTMWPDMFLGAPRPVYVPNLQTYLRGNVFKFLPGKPLSLERVAVLNASAKQCILLQIHCWIEKLYANDMFVDKPAENMLRDMLYDDSTGQLHFVDFENYNKTFGYQRNNNAIILQEFENLFKSV
ncbi:nesp037 [Neophasia sp. alphabaculovirus]|nr:nesp037 [Neophasia sp. alphabaculovirus]